MKQWIGAFFCVLATSPFAATAPADFETARSLFQQGELAAAQQAFEALAAADPTAAEVNFYLGEIALRSNDSAKAITYLERAAAAAPTVSRTHHRLGDAYGRAAQKASLFSALSLARKCVRAFERAVELDPGNIAARYSLFTFYRGAPSLIGGGLDKAAAEAAAISRLDPDRGRIALAALHVSRKKFADARAVLAEIRPVKLAEVERDRIFLSDVEWTSATVGWGQPARNHTWFDEDSHPGVVLIVHGRLYSKGLYAHSPSRYTFALDRKWKIFTAIVGLREGVDRSGSAVFIVRGDGRELFRSTTLRVDESQQVKIDVTDIRELELVTEPEEAHNHFSWAIWADPLIQR